ncbi:MAG: PGPGW domain-containing protein [bacterium]|nr:PGPGW domain-containing protein [bacterium]
MGILRRTIRKTCGYTLVVLGVIGLFLPVLQGVAMILAGAALLGWDLKPVKDLVARARARFRR